MMPNGVWHWYVYDKGLEILILDDGKWLEATRIEQEGNQ